MAKLIPKQTLEEIRFRNDIIDVIGDHVQVKRAGSTFKALCPFHKEKTPSFTLNQQRQSYHCFGCGAGGDVFSFIQEIEGVDFMMAAEMLAQRAGIQIDFENGSGAPASEKEVLFKIHEEVARFYQRCLLQMPAAGPAREYLKDRELGADVLEDFLVGFAPDSWDAVIRWGEKHSYSIEQLEKAGLVSQGESRDGKARAYDRFRNRIMFSVRDAQARTVAFSGRVLKKQAKAAKYVNSPETPIFHKSRVLYALDKARKPIVSSDSREAIVCEGQIDVIRCHSAGFNTAVACQGTAFTPDHARLLKRYADSAVIVFDPDTAGQNAAIKTAALFMESGLAVRVASLPEGQDPDSFILKEGKDAFQGILDNAETAVGYQIQVLSAREDVSSEVGVRRVSKAVLETITRCPSEVQRAKLMQIAAERLEIPVTALQGDLSHLQRRQQQRKPPSTTPVQERPVRTDQPARKAAAPREELELCVHLTQNSEEPASTELVASYLPLQLITSERCRTLIAAALEAQSSERDIQDVLREQDDAEGELRQLAAKVFSAMPRVEGREFTHADAIRGLILRIWRRYFERERADLYTRESTDHEAQHRCRELTQHINHLRTWEDGKPIIEIEMLDLG